MSSFYLKDMMMKRICFSDYVYIYARISTKTSVPVVVLSSYYYSFSCVTSLSRLCLQTAMEECGEALTNEMDLEPYFVDFMREAPEPTGS